MKLFIVAMCVAAALGDVSHVVRTNNPDKDAQIVSQTMDIDQEGKYRSSFETSNGISQSEEGALKNPQSEDAAEEVQGQATWTSPEGEQVQLTYVANENGYQPQGSHIPTPPPIPQAILRALEYIRSHPPQPSEYDN